MLGLNTVAVVDKVVRFHTLGVRSCSSGCSVVHSSCSRTSLQYINRYDVMTSYLILTL